VRLYEARRGDLPSERVAVDSDRALHALIHRRELDRVGVRGDSGAVSFSRPGGKAVKETQGGWAMTTFEEALIDAVMRHNRLSRKDAESLVANSGKRSGRNFSLKYQGSSSSRR